MTTNIFSHTTPADAVSSEPHGLLGALVVLALAAAAYLKRKVALRSELLTRAEFYYQVRLMSYRIHANHVSLLEKLDSNHRELLAALEQQGNRIGGLEAGFARLDERSRK
jgi:hypothetical protein